MCNQFRYLLFGIANTYVAYALFYQTMDVNMTHNGGQIAKLVYTHSLGRIWNCVLFVGLVLFRLPICVLDGYDMKSYVAALYHICGIAILLPELQQNNVLLFLWYAI